MCVLNGELYVVGRFEKVNGLSANNVAKFNGVEWCVYNDVFDSYINQVEVFNNEVYIAGLFEHINSVPVLRIAKLSSVATTSNCTAFDGLTESSLLNFKIRPNPFIDLFNIDFEYPLYREIKIVDFQGRIIKNISSHESKISIDTNDVNSGVYLIIINENGKKM